MKGIGLINRNVMVILNKFFNCFKKYFFLAKTCGVLKEFFNGERKLEYGDGIGYGSVYTYKCASGYRREGAETILCQSNGQWSSDQPLCKSM